MWDNRRDAAMQLVDTVVRKGNSPVIIHDILTEADVLFARCRTLATGRYHTVRLDELNCKPVPLGYINMRDRCCYGSRIARRRWKAGLDRSNLWIVGNGARAGAYMCPTSNKRPLTACIQGVYPTLEECMQEVVTATRSKAFCRTLAVGAPRTPYGHNLALYYKGVKVSDHMDGKEVMLSKPYEYLSQIVQEYIDVV